MTFEYGVQIRKGLTIRTAYFQIKMNAGRPGFFSFFYGDYLIGQDFNRLFVLLNLPLDQQGTVFHQQIPRIGK